MKVGLISGAGLLPVILAQEAKYAGRQVLVISITKNPDERLVSLAHPDFFQFGPGQVKRILDTLLKMEVQEVFIIGKVSKDILFKPLHMDTKALRILSKLKNRSDSSLFRAIADEMESMGLNLIDQRRYLGKLLPQKGVITKRKPSKSEWKDIEYGMDLARKI
ncbi:LpxI family protein, partial [Candidatus Poribacteria bacterium]|nr:LpxI family protein [Candidatus Poribacteria bacterium]